jgi:hypothetical protein
VYGKKVVNHYRTCCDSLIIDSGVHYFFDASKPGSDGSGRLSELTNPDYSRKLSELTNAVSHANSSDTHFVTHFRANDATTDSGDSRRNSGATDNATREPSILQRPVRGEY